MPKGFLFGYGSPGRANCSVRGFFCCCEHQDRTMDYIYHESFDDEARQAEILSPAPEAAVRQQQAPPGVPPHLAVLYGEPLLSATQESHLFRKMNYLKYCAARLRDALAASRAGAAATGQIEELLRQAREVKNVLIRANLRLVASVVKKYARAQADFSELLSDGNLSLMGAIDCFDFSRGFKFSTYAFWALRKNLLRAVSAEHFRRTRYCTGVEHAIQGVVDGRACERQEEQRRAQYRDAVNR